MRSDAAYTLQNIHFNIWKNWEKNLIRHRKTSQRIWVSQLSRFWNIIWASSDCRLKVKLISHIDILYIYIYIYIYIICIYKHTHTHTHTHTHIYIYTVKNVKKWWIYHSVYKCNVAKKIFSLNLNWSL